VSAADTARDSQRLWRIATAAEACLAGTYYPGDAGKLRHGGDQLYGMTTADVLGRLLLFERSGRSVADEFWRFTTVNLFGTAQVSIISGGLGEYTFFAAQFPKAPSGYRTFHRRGCAGLHQLCRLSSLCFAKIAE
jgi:hypothetical protein